MKKRLTFFNLLFIIPLLSGCDFLSNILGVFNKNAPTYTGMTVSNSDIEINEDRVIKRQTRANTIETYEVKKSEDFYFVIHIENPNRYEIQSFTLNNVKYASYMFEKGSDLETLYLKSHAQDELGEYSYTIDAIKYIDGTQIKNVNMSGEKTIKTKVVNYIIHVDYDETRGRVYTTGSYETGDFCLHAEAFDGFYFCGWRRDNYSLSYASLNENYFMLGDFYGDYYLSALFLPYDEASATHYDRYSSSDDTNLIKTTFEGYRVALDVHDGKRYLLGAYDNVDDALRFANGNTFDGFNEALDATNNSVSGAAEVELKMYDKDLFTLQFFCEGKSLDRKYISVYKKSEGTSVSFGLCFVDEPTLEVFEDTEADETPLIISSVFRFDRYDYARADGYIPSGLIGQALFTISFLTNQYSNNSFVTNPSPFYSSCGYYIGIERQNDGDNVESFSGISLAYPGKTITLPSPYGGYGTTQARLIKMNNGFMRLYEKI